MSAKESSSSRLNFYHDLRDADQSFISLNTKSPTTQLYAVNHAERWCRRIQPKFNTFIKTSGFNIKVNNGSKKSLLL